MKIMGLRQGFSLLQLSLIIAVASLVVSQSLENFGHNQPHKNTITLERARVIEKAMEGFMAANRRRPCPANLFTLLTNANFGKELENPGICTSASLGPDISGKIVAGAVPVAALGLSQDYAFDGYGQRFTYFVDRRATQSLTCRSLSSGSIGISTPKGLSQYAMVALLSHGADGIGAVPAAGR